MHITMETELSLETAFRNSVPRHKEVHWLHYRCYIVEHKVCSVTSEPTQSSSRRGTEFQKAILKAELCFHRYVHFACVLGFSKKGRVELPPSHLLVTSLVVIC